MIANHSNYGSQSAPAGSWQGNSSDRLVDASLLTSARNMSSWIFEAENHLGTIRAILFGEGQENSTGKQPAPGNVAGIVSDAGTRMASMCGDLRTLINRLEQQQPG